MTLSAAPAVGYQFASWTVSNPSSVSSDCGTAPTCTVTFDSSDGGNVGVTATFVPVPGPQASTGSGSLSSRSPGTHAVELASTTENASSSSGLLIIIFFLLLGIALFARQVRNTRRPKEDGLDR